MFGLRAPMPLVAAVLLIAVVAAVFVGGRIILDWNSLHNGTPAGQHGSATLAQLEGIPLNLPVLKPGDPCPTSVGTSKDHEFGTGPVFVDGGQQITTSWGYFYDVTYYTQPRLTGLVIVRGRDLYSDRRTVFVSPYAAGPTVGTDTEAGAEPLRTELVLDASRPPAHHQLTGDGMWPVRQGMAKGWTGCIGFEIDTLDFRETITGNFPPT